jgi:hypothetical protein
MHHQSLTKYPSHCDLPRNNFIFSIWRFIILMELLIIFYSPLTIFRKISLPHVIKKSLHYIR